MHRIVRGLINQRKAARMTQAALAEATGLPLWVISDMENRGGSKTLTTLDRMAAGLGLQLGLSRKPSQ